MSQLSNMFLMMPSMAEIHSLPAFKKLHSLNAIQNLEKASKLNLQSLTNLLELPQNYYEYL